MPTISCHGMPVKPSVGALRKAVQAVVAHLLGVEGTAVSLTAALDVAGLQLDTRLQHKKLVRAAISLAGDIAETMPTDLSEPWQPKELSSAGRPEADKELPVRA